MDETWYALDKALVQLEHERLQRLTEERWQRYWSEQQCKHEQNIVQWEWRTLDEIVEQVKAAPLTIDVEELNRLAEREWYEYCLGQNIHHHE